MNKKWVYYNRNYRRICKQWFEEKRIYWFEQFGWQFYYLYTLLRSIVTRKPSLVRCHHLVTTLCTLKCKECSCLIPYYKKERHILPLSFDKFKEEFDAILEAVDLIYCFIPLGGEPFMAKDLHKMVEYATAKPQILHIQIVTNGTLIPQQEFINVAKNNKKLRIVISNYDSNEELKYKLKNNELIELFKANNIQYYKPSLGKLTWHSRSEFFEVNEGSNKARENYYTCGAKFCNTYAKGRFYLCHVCAYMDINSDNYNLNKNEYADMLNNINKKQDLIKYWQNKYFEACGWCKCNYRKANTAEQLEQKEPVKQ